jgi:hypothetical protein
MPAPFVPSLLGVQRAFGEPPGDRSLRVSLHDRDTDRKEKRRAPAGIRRQRHSERPTCYIPGGRSLG